ncbi:MAG TPA: hypothetical protein GXZ95_01705 [Mollicutes bacterium]|nr:hypothetical protein [Mollicutes bacterium]
MSTKETNIGVGLLALYLVLDRFTSLPDLLLGFILGIGISLFLVGMLSQETRERLKGVKKRKKAR